VTPLCCEFPILKEWVKNSPPNDKIIYYTGYSATDSIISSEISSYMYKQAVKGVVYLVRRRMVEDRRLFDYIAIKASPTPVFRLLPLPQDKLEVMYRQNRQTRGARHYVRHHKEPTS